MAQAGSIKEISDSVSARTSQGQVRELNVGDLVYENELIETSDGSRVTIELDNGKTIDLSENAQILIDESVIGVVDVRDAVVSEVESLQAALEAGEDIFDAADSHVDGGEGFDTLLVSDINPDPGTPIVLDFSNVDNVEKIDLNDAGVQTITLSLDDVLDMMTDSTNNVLEITGGKGDVVTLTGVVDESIAVDGEWVYNGSGLFTQVGSNFQVTINSPNDPTDNFSIITDNGDTIDV